MPSIVCDVTSRISQGFRVSAIRGSYGFSDVNVAHSIRANLPNKDDDWQVGAIVGVSGSGKTLLAKAYDAQSYYIKGEWLETCPVIENIVPKDIPLNDIIDMFTSLGFSSVPKWLLPYHVLSMGEQMRVELARALLLSTGCLIFDEFTSVVDRHTAQIIALALGKHLRRINAKAINKRLIVVSCHDDYLDALQCDWILRVPSETPEWRCAGKERALFRFAIYHAERSLWNKFREHHYMNHALHHAAKCFACVDVVRNLPVGFLAILPSQGWKGRDRVSRIVILPEYQGVGIGKRFLDAVAMEHERTHRSLSIVTAHPAFINSLARSSNWKCVHKQKLGAQHTNRDKKFDTYLKRTQVGFIWRGDENRNQH